MRERGQLAGTFWVCLRFHRTGCDFRVLGLPLSGAHPRGRALGTDVRSDAIGRLAIGNGSARLPEVVAAPRTH